MKLHTIVGPVAIAAVMWVVTVHADDDPENRFSFSARLGFNTSVRFNGVALTPAGGSGTRTAPNGVAYNYDDGYVLTDISGNAGGQTWNWGYDDSSRQISGDTILMSKTTGTGTSKSSSADGDPSCGGELVYSRHLGDIGRFKYGFELAGNYMNISVNDNRRLPVGLTRTTDAFPFTDGTVPPSATPESPYQGSFEGPGFLIGATPVGSTSSEVDGFSSGTRHFEADIWGLRVGPYLEFPVTEKFQVSVSGGFAGALVDAKANWSESVSIDGTAGPKLSGSGSDSKFLVGVYIAANAGYRFDEHWSVVGSVQFQHLQSYEHSFGGRGVTLDLTKGIFVAVGVGYSF